MKTLKIIFVVNLICLFLGSAVLFASSMVEVPGKWRFEIIDILPEYGPNEIVTGKLQLTNLSSSDFMEFASTGFMPPGAAISISDGYTINLSYINPAAVVTPSASVTPWEFTFTPATPPVAAGIYDISFTLSDSRPNGVLESGPNYTEIALDTQFKVVPEPATVVLLGFGLLGFAGISRKEK